MSIHVQAQGFSLTQPLEQYVQERLTFALGNRFQNIGKLRVRLSDINGPKGGADKRCSLHIALPQQPDLVINEVQPDMYDAINKAVRRARQSLGRRVSRVRKRAQGRKADKSQWPSDSATAADNEII